MSVKLAPNEKVIRNYAYGTTETSKGLRSKVSSKSLIITNKRIIHQTVSRGTGSESISISDMPVSAAKYVDTSFGKKSFTIFAILAGICFLLMIAMFTGKIWGGGIAALAFCGIFVALYIFIKTYSLTCEIKSQAVIYTPLYISTEKGSNSFFSAFFRANRNPGGKLRVKITVNPEVAKEMAEELSSVIIAVANGEFDENI